jgi:hypothetical protein
MAINRRAFLGGLGPAVALPYLLRSSPAEAGVTVKLVGTDLVIAGDQPGGQRDVSLWAFSDGSYAAGWLNTRDLLFTDVRACVQKFSRNGTPLSPIIELGGGTLTDGNPASSISGVALPNDTSLIFFSAAPNGSASDSDIFVQRLSRRFNPMGDVMRLNTRRTGLQFGVRATALTDGNVQVVWESMAPDFSSSTIRGIQVQPDGDPLTPEGTLIRKAVGSNTARALTLYPNGGALMSYTEVFFDGTQTLWTNKLQRLDDNRPLGLPRVFPSAPATSPCGSVGLLCFDPRDGEPGPRDDLAYLFAAPDTGDVAELQQCEVNFGSTPIIKAVDDLRIDPGYGGCPQVVPCEVDGVPYSVGFCRTERSSGKNTMTAMAIRRSNGAPRSPVICSFEEIVTAIDSAVALRPGSSHRSRVIVACSSGNSATDEDAMVFQFSIENP